MMLQFAERWKKMYGWSDTDQMCTSKPSFLQSRSIRKQQRRRARPDSDVDTDSDSDSDFDEEASGSSSMQGPSCAQSKPWLMEFEKYLRMPDGMMSITKETDLIHWWGVSAFSFVKIIKCSSSNTIYKANGHMYPVWASLAQDYLAIMASSVSSERAFSSAGMTITKRCNRLTHDIVEALQILKAAIREDLLFRPGSQEPSKALELALLVEQGEAQAVTGNKKDGEPSTAGAEEEEEDILVGTESTDGICAIAVGDTSF